MQKMVRIYILMIILIAGLVGLIIAPFKTFDYIPFPRGLHTFVEGINTILMFLISFVCNYIYTKAKEERLVIIAGGYFVGAIFNCLHIITAHVFPYDLLSIANLQKNPALVYLLFSNLILPFSIYFAIIHKPAVQTASNFRLKIYSTYSFIFLVFAILPILVHYFLPETIPKLYIIMHALEFINYSLYIMLAFMIINIRQASNITFFPMFTTGLLICGFGGLYYINPTLIQANEILAHIFQAIGLAFLLLGIPHFRTYAKYLRFKDELVAYLCLMLIAFYILFVSLTSAIFHIIFPAFSAFLFVEFLLISQFIIYLLVNNVTKPITNLTDALNKYTPGEEPINIQVMRQDEIGTLTEKINATARLSWEKISEISRLARRERSIIKIFETIRRISNQNIIKNTIMDEVKKAFNPDKCFIALYNAVNNSLYFDRYAENIPSKMLDETEEEMNNILKDKAYNDFLKINLDFYFTNIEDYIERSSLQGSEKEKILRKHNIKSCYNVPIYYANNLLGCLVLLYINDYKELDQTDLSYLKTVATQIGIAINESTK